MDSRRQDDDGLKDLSAFLRPFGHELDQVVARATRLMVDEGADWSAYEVRSALTDLKSLGEGGDVAYDRRSIGAHYALWYHLKRTHGMVRFLAARYLGTAGEVTLLDLGSGTGATAWAAAILNAAQHRGGWALPRLRVVGIDSSPYMTEAATALWAEFEASSLARGCEITPSFRLGSWMDPNAVQGISKPVVVGSYLLDHSDDEIEADLARRLAKLFRSLGATEGLFVTAAAKTSVLRNVVKLAEMHQRDARIAAPIWQGYLVETAEVRNRWLSRYEIPDRRPDWGPRALRAIAATRFESQMFPGREPELIEDEEQDAAARPKRRLTFLVGAAGSGKSRVLVERSARIVEQATPSEVTPRILITAFNVSMIEQLAEWLLVRLERGGLLETTTQTVKGYWRVYARGPRSKSEIVLMNRDKLPSRVLHVCNGAVRDHQWSLVMERIRARAENDVGLRAKYQRLEERFGARLGEFLREELERIIYGLDGLERARYVTKSFRRVGRRDDRISLETRGDVWDLLVSVKDSDHYLYRRIKAYQTFRSSIEAGSPLPLNTDRPWTHVLVDEAQDFTPSDIRLLACIPTDPANVFMAGDAAQSMHIGSTFRCPAIPNRSWQRLSLSGSYRMPIRTAKAVQRLARHIALEHRAQSSDVDTVSPAARKSVLLGPRPVVFLDGADREDERRRMFREVGRFAIGRSTRVSVVDEVRRSEYVRELSEEVRSLIAGAAAVKSESMEQIKGLERDVVIMSTKILPPGEDTAAEWIYTALTRSTCVTVLLLSDQMAPGVEGAISKLDSAHLNFWDEVSERAFRMLF